MLQKKLNRVRIKLLEAGHGGARKQVGTSDKAQQAVLSSERRESHVQFRVPWPKDTGAVITLHSDGTHIWMISAAFVNESFLIESFSNQLDVLRDAMQAKLGMQKRVRLGLLTGSILYFHLQIGMGSLSMDYIDSVQVFASLFSNWA